MAHTTSTTSNISLSRRRLGAVGARGLDTTTAFSMVIGAGLIAAMGWWAYVALRPLPQPEAERAAATPPEVRLVTRVEDMTQRKDRIASLGESNMFSFGRKTWTSQVAGGGPDGAAPASSAQPVIDPKATLAADAVPIEIKPALDNLELKAIYLSKSGLSAVVSLIAPEPRASIVVTEGKEFTDKQFPQANWKVLSIDPRSKRLLLARTGKQVALVMYKNAPIRAEAPRVAAAGAAKEPVVVAQSREEILRKLREANVSEADIAILMAQIGTPGTAPEPQGGGVAEALKKALGTDGTAPAAAPVPSGMEEVLRMMATGRPPPGMEQPKPAEPAKSDPPKKDPAPPK